MNSVWQALIWKEWCEHRWKLAALSAIVVSVFIVCIDYRYTRDLQFALIVPFYFLVPLAALFASLGAAAGEHSRGTLGFLQAKPHSLRKLAALKLLFAWLTVAVPITLLVCLLACWTELGDAFNWSGVRIGNAEDMIPIVIVCDLWQINLWLTACVAALSLVIWCAVCGVNRRDEVGAGAVSLAVVTAVWFLSILGAIAILPRGPITPELARCCEVIYAALPGGIGLSRVMAMDRPSNLANVAGGFFAMHSPLALLFIFRYGRSVRRRHSLAHTPKQTAKRLEWLSPPRPSPVAALGWKAFRESAPVALLGLAAAVATTLSICAAQSHRNESYWDFSFGFVAVASTGSAMLTFFGFLVGTVTGVGAASDLQPKAIEFWRSRPIQIDQWFWTRFFVGLAFLVASFSLPAWGLLVWSAHLSDFLLALPNRDQTQFTEGLIVVLAPLMAYGTAWLAAALTRKIVIAMLIGVGLSLILLFCNSTYLPDHAVAQLTAMLVASVAMTLFSWLAVRYDWALRK